MAAGPPPPMNFLRHLRSAVSGGAPAVSDAELIDRFSRDRDEAAFELLVWRHGRLVWGVCRRVARDRHAAEDAFQATFLALARHAGSVANRSVVAGWLYRVAYRAALEAKRRVRGRAEPLADAEMVADRSPSPPEEAARRDLRRVIDAEVTRLPEPFRAAFVLCELQGVSNAEAAAALGCPVGTVESRLTRARAKLARRLSARGVTTAGGFAGLTAATVPDAVFAAALRAGVEGSAGASAGVAALAARASEASVWPRAAGLIVAAAAVAAVGLSVAQNPGTGSPDTPTAKKATTGQPAVDPLPDGAIARLGSARFRTPFAAWYPVYSRDGNSLAVAGWDAVRVFDTRTGQVTFTARFERSEPGGSLPVPKFAPSGSLVVLHAASRNAAPKVSRFDGAGKALGRIELRGPNGGHWLGTELSEDAARAAAVWGPAPVLRIYDARTGVPIRDIPLGPPNTNPGPPVLSPDGRRVAVTTAGTVRVFEVDTGAEVDSWAHPTRGHPIGITFLPDGKRVVTYSHGTDRAIKVRDTAAHKTVDELPEQSVWWVTASPDGGRLAYGTSGRVTVWDLVKRQVVHTLNRGCHFRNGAFSPDGGTLATGEVGGTVTLWNLRTGRALPVSADPPGQPNALRLLADGRVMARLTHRWIVWDTPDGPPAPLKWPASYYLHGCDLSPDGSRVVSCGPDGVTALDARTGDRVWSEKPAGGGAAYTAWHYREQLVVACETAVEVRDAATGQLEKTIPVTNIGMLLGVTPDGRRAFTETVLGMLTDNRKVSALDLGSGKQLWTETENGIENNQGVATSPDGRLVAWYSPRREPNGAVHVLRTGRVVVREAATGRPVWQAEEDKLYVQSLDFSPDGRLLATAEHTGRVRLWDARTGKPVWEFKHGTAATAVAFSPDGMTLAAASADAPVYLWDVFGTRTRNGPPPNRAALQLAVTDLADDDPAVAFRAARTLHAAPGGAVAAIRDGVKPVAVPDPASVRRLIAELDSPDFRTRDAAERTLTDHAPYIKRAVKGALGADPSAERRERLARVLAAADKPTVGDRQRERAAAILKRIGGREALKAIGSPVGQ